MPLEKSLEPHPKIIKTYDIFTFFNELELLEIRLNLLDKVVDYFVIVECGETFSGLTKPLYYQENSKRFEKFLPKIIHFVIKDVPKDFNDAKLRLQKASTGSLDESILKNALTSENVPKNQIHWLKEFYQKECIKKSLLNLQDDDICYISDIDEIWNPNVKINLTDGEIFKLRQLVYAYYVNNRSNEPWAGTLVTKYKNIKSNCLNHLRTASKTKYTYVNYAGWHFTNQGGAEQIRYKIEASYGKEDLNNDKIKLKIEKKMKKNQDYIGRKFKFWVDESDLPSFLLENKDKYQHLFKQPEHGKPSFGDSIIVKLHGGLGNQLFQYALGRNLTLTKHLKVKYDLSWFAEQKKRQYELDIFNTQVAFAEPKEVKKLKKSGKKGGYLNIIRDLLFANDSIYIKEKHFNFEPEILNIQPPAYLEGYWQSEKYFNEIAQQIRQDLTLKNPLTPAKIGQIPKTSDSQTISLHIRRTDYLAGSNGLYHICPLDYYYAAIKEIIRTQKNIELVVFSDDIDWVKTNLKTEYPAVFISGNKSYEDLTLMSLCQHNIIANSTFSLWGAWLNPNPNKIVITPKNWFTDPTMNTRDLIPNSWIKI